MCLYFARILTKELVTLTLYLYFIYADGLDWQLSELSLNCLLRDSADGGEDDPWFGIHLLNRRQNIVRDCVVQREEGNVPRLANLKRENDDRSDYLFTECLPAAIVAV